MPNIPTMLSNDSYKAAMLHVFSWIAVAIKRNVPFVSSIESAFAQVLPHRVALRWQ
jgi:hypothetical protein